MIFISKYAYLQCYGTAFRTTGTTTWVDKSGGFDSHFYTLKQNWQLGIKATAQFCEFVQTTLSFAVACSRSWMEISSGQSFHQLNFFEDYLEDYLGVWGLPWFFKVTGSQAVDVYIFFLPYNFFFTLLYDFKLLHCLVKACSFVYL